MLTYATTFQPLPEEAGASQESWRIWLQSSLFLFVLITALVLKRLASSPATQILLLLSPSSISFNSPFGHSQRDHHLDAANIEHRPWHGVSVRLDGVDGGG